jgi:hypothetical protein
MTFELIIVIYSNIDLNVYLISIKIEFIIKLSNR